jgi:copper chaperone CopZ
MITETFWIHGMTGEHSVRTVNSELIQLPIDVRKIDLASAVVEYDPLRIPRQQIELAIRQAGFEVSNPSTASALV